MNLSVALEPDIHIALSIFEHQPICIDASWTAPGTWLATDDSDRPGFAERLTATLGDLASIADQSDGLVVFTLLGTDVRETFGRIVPIDLHPLAFKVDQVAVTQAAHIPLAPRSYPDSLKTACHSC